MGTWKLPDTTQEKDKLYKKFLKLRKLQDEILNLYGDDIFLDHIELAIERLSNVCTHVTPDCKHQAYYLTETGPTPGVCKHCRLNVKEE